MGGGGKGLLDRSEEGCAGGSRSCANYCMCSRTRTRTHNKTGYSPIGVPSLCRLIVSGYVVALGLLARRGETTDCYKRGLSAAERSTCAALLR